MSVPSLIDIEKTLGSLWMNRELREWYLAGANPDKAPPEAEKISLSILKNLDSKGVKLYGELLNFGHHDVMLSVFPYCAQILDDKWDKIVDDYLKHFPPEHYNFNRTCSRFPEYISGLQTKLGPMGEFLSELADWEWLELDIIEMDTVVDEYPYKSLDNPQQLGGFAPILNPSISIRQYKYPLFELIDLLQDGQLPEVLPKEESYVAFYRHPVRNTCCFYDLDYFSKLLIEKSKVKTAYQALAHLYISEREGLNPAEAAEEFLETIDELQNHKLFVGSQPVS